MNLVLPCFIAAVLIAVLITKCIQSNEESEHEASIASTTSSTVQRQCQRQRQRQRHRRQNVVISIPMKLDETEPSSSCTDTTSHEIAICVICLGEFEKGEFVSVLRRCKHMFHNACIKQWVPEKSMNCPICRVLTLDLQARPTWITGQIA